MNGYNKIIYVYMYMYVKNTQLYNSSVNTVEPRYKEVRSHLPGYNN